MNKSNVIHKSSYVFFLLFLFSANAIAQSTNCQLISGQFICETQDPIGDFNRQVQQDEQNRRLQEIANQMREQQRAYEERTRILQNQLYSQQQQQTQFQPSSDAEIVDRLRDLGESFRPPPSNSYGQGLESALQLQRQLMRDDIEDRRRSLEFRRKADEDVMRAAASAAAALASRQPQIPSTDAYRVSNQAGSQTAGPAMQPEVINGASAQSHQQAPVSLSAAAVAPNQNKGQKPWILFFGGIATAAFFYFALGLWKLNRL